MNRRDFLLSLVAVPGLLSDTSARASESSPSIFRPLVLDNRGQARFVLRDRINHPYYWWPTTLLSYRVQFDPGLDLARQVLTRTDTGARLPIQFSDLSEDGPGRSSATLSFFGDLPSGGEREFILAEHAPASQWPSQVTEEHEESTIVLSSGAVRVRIPGSQIVQGTAPGPVMQLSRGGHWFGSSSLSFEGEPVTRITSRRTANGPLFVSYTLDYEGGHGSRYQAKVTCIAGMDFVRLEENMEGLRAGTRGKFTTTWNDLAATHRQAPNHPFPLTDDIRNYDEYPWEPIGAPFRVDMEPLLEDQLPFNLGIYERAPANFHTATWANFWNRATDDAIGVFIDDVAGWHDHEYAYEIASPLLQVRFFSRGEHFDWEWPLAPGRRSTCLTCYDHAKDREAMRDLELTVGSADHKVPLTFTSHTLWLQNRYGSLELNKVKDWVLEYPEGARKPSRALQPRKLRDPRELVSRIMGSAYVCTLPVTGTRQMAGHGPIPGRSIVNFSPVPSRQILSGWVEDFAESAPALTEADRSRLTAILLFLGYVHAGDEFMPLVNMLAGHPNFLADVKAVPPAMTFLFPEHPLAATWADMWDKCVQLNTRFNTRPAVDLWQAQGGRWTENLGTYVWAFLRPSLRTDYILKAYDGHERFLSPQLADMAQWLVNALSAPFKGESKAAYENLMRVDQGREWGVVGPGDEPRRVHPPQGAHSEQRQTPRALWYLGTCLRRYAPLSAEYAMWAARPSDLDSESSSNARSPWDGMYEQPDNRGTNPHLKTAKFTGYGIVLRAGVDTSDEISVHLQQVDEGPNYRWGRAGEGGSGILYFYAGGKSYSYTAPEDVGDRDDQDTDFCTNFGVFREGRFHTMGMNVLSRPLYDLGTGQFAEIVPRQGPTTYSFPEYLSRSVLLAGREYFVLYDSVSDQELVHRLTWFVRKGDPFPTIKLLLGAFGSRETQRTDLTTSSSSGAWFDGIGDSLAVVSHREDIQAEGTPFGCRVTLPGISDLVFRRPQAVRFSEGDFAFEGTAGLIRSTEGRTEFALFHGTLIAIKGLTATTNDTDLGISGCMEAGKNPSGEIFAPSASALRLKAPGLPAGTRLYIDGSAWEHQDANGWFDISLQAGPHHWELTQELPVPKAPSVRQTIAFSAGAQINVESVNGAQRYRLEASGDNGVQWKALQTQEGTEFKVSGLQNGTKIHVRAVAINSSHESAAGPEYPLYVTAAPPPPPDGLRLELSDGAAALTWGEILGASHYRLYARLAPATEFQVIYEGPDRRFTDKRSLISRCAEIPGPTMGSPRPGTVEYTVTAVNGNGESEKSRIANTEPTSWRNWDPRPGERFRRVTSYASDLPARPADPARYYP